MLNLTIVVPVKNEATNLWACLDAIGAEFAERVVVIDSNSNDSTCQIARDWGAEVFHFKWNGLFPKKRNWFLQEHTPTTRWVMFLDADEFLSPAFKQELAHTLPQSELSGYWLRYSVYFLGKELKYGYPLDKLALFRVGTAEYERVEEDQWSSLDMEIHEHPIVQGLVGKIKSKIDHRDMRSVSHYVSKHNEYSSWEARRFVAQPLANAKQDFTLKQRVKYALVESPFAGIVYFCGAYIAMRGFLDGSRGLAFALLKASYFTQIYCKIRELRAKDESNGQDLS